MRSARFQGSVMGVRNIYERFIWFDTRARAHGYPNASSLAAHFETSTKTAQRDIDFMRDRLFCPLEYDMRQKGYYYEDDTFSLPMVYLSSGELSALLIARKMLQDVSGGQIGGEISSVIEKITNVLSRHVRKENEVEEAVSLQLIEYSPAPERVFRSVIEACLARRRLRFTYTSPAANGETERAVDPYHLFNYMGNWHLIGHCHLRNHLRDFALNRISNVKVLEETFEKPEAFDARAYFRSSFGIFKGKERKEVALRFSPDKAKWIKDQIWHPDQKARFLKDGSLELSFPVADFSEIKMEILKHGDAVEVIKPEGLRLLIEAEAESIVKAYRGNRKRRRSSRRPRASTLPVGETWGISHPSPSSP